MTHTDLGNDLTITDVREGTILQWISTNTAVVDTFIIRMSPAMITSLEVALGSPNVKWEAEDRGLTIRGDRTSLTLAFQMREPPFERLSLRLNEPEAARFREEIAKRAKSG